MREENLSLRIQYILKLISLNMGKILLFSAFKTNVIWTKQRQIILCQKWMNKLIQGLPRNWSINIQWNLLQEHRIFNTYLQMYRSRLQIKNIFLIMSLLQGRKSLKFKVQELHYKMNIKIFVLRSNFTKIKCKKYNMRIWELRMKFKNIKNWSQIGNKMKNSF